jgi:hypothetical protein
MKYKESKIVYGFLIKNDILFSDYIDKEFEKKCKQGVAIGIPGDAKYIYLPLNKPISKCTYFELLTVVTFVKTKYCTKDSKLKILNNNLYLKGIHL